MLKRPILWPLNLLEGPLQIKLALVMSPTVVGLDLIVRNSRVSQGSKASQQGGSTTIFFFFRSALLEIYEKIPSTFEARAPSSFLPSVRPAEESPKVEPKSSNFSTSFQALRDHFSSASPTPTNDADVGSGSMPKRRKVDSEVLTSVKKYFVPKSPQKCSNENSPKIEFFEKSECKRSQEVEKVSNTGPKIEFFGKENFRSNQNSDDSSMTTTNLNCQDIEADGVGFESQEEPTSSRRIDVDVGDAGDVIGVVDGEPVNTEASVQVPVITSVRVWDEEVLPGFELGRRKTVSVNFSVDELRKNLSNKKVENSDKEVFRRFLAQINPTENEIAEQELRKEFKKDDFKLMKIFGQVRYPKPALWVCYFMVNFACNLPFGFGCFTAAYP